MSGKLRTIQVWAVIVKGADSLVGYNTEDEAEKAAEKERRAGREARVRYLGETSIISFRTLLTDGDEEQAK